MRYVLVGVLAVFMVGCDSGGVAGPASPGAAGAAGDETVDATGAAGTGLMAKPPAEAGADADMCRASRPCEKSSYIYGTERFSSPTCPGRICGQCVAPSGLVLHDCYVDIYGPDKLVYCDNRGTLGMGNNANDCN